MALQKECNMTKFFSQIEGREISSFAGTTKNSKKEKIQKSLGRGNKVLEKKSSDGNERPFLSLCLRVIPAVIITRLRNTC